MRLDNMRLPSSKRRSFTALFVFVLARTCAAASCPIPGDTLFANDFELSSGVTRYVATAGSNVGEGTFAAPWQTIQYAASNANAGDTVCVRAGVYNEIVSVTRSGSAFAGTIVFQNYPGETAVVDGTALSVPNNQWGLITLQNRSYVTVRGFEVRNYQTASTALVPIGIYVTGAGNDVTIAGNHIHDIKNTGGDSLANAFGLKINGTAAPASINHLNIIGNELDHLVLGSSESLSLDGNVEIWTISDNLVHDTNNIAIGAIGFEGIAPDPAYDQARDGTISGNTVYNISSFGNPAYGNVYSADGIYVDGGTRIVIERNRVHHVDLGIEMASEHLSRTTSYVTARNNLVYLGNSAGISLGGYAATVGGTDNCSIVNNTLFHNDSKQTGSGELQIQYHASNNLIVNNIVYANVQGLLLNAFTNDSPNPATLDYNLYFSDAGTGASNWVWKATSYGNLATYRTASAQDVHSGFADPQFLNLLTPNLQVASTSPVIGAGTNLGPGLVGGTDFAGHPRVQGTVIDVGAYEH